MSVNKVILVGNLGADPESRTTASGVQVTTLRLATTERRKDAESQTEWHRVVCFGKTAEAVQKVLTKGRQIYVEGKIHSYKYTDKQGVERYMTEIVADTVQFLGSPTTAAPAQTAADDIPF
jgi:single-strand DNA-binding protein